MRGLRRRPTSSTSMKVLLLSLSPALSENVGSGCAVAAGVGSVCCFDGVDECSPGSSGSGRDGSSVVIDVGDGWEMVVAESGCSQLYASC